MKNKCGLNDTVIDVFMKLSEGNPGALNVCMQIVSDGPKIDPDCARPLITLLTFDDLGIYGSRIWMLYKDVCDQDLEATLGVMRGHQLGYVTEWQLNHAIDNRGDGLDVVDILSQVQEFLPNFGTA